MQASSPIVKDLVLVGGGHSHVAVLKMLAMKPVSGLRVTLVTRDVETPYSGMLPGLIAGQYAFDDAHIDLRPLCEFAGARLFHDTVVGVDLERRTLECKNRPPVAFDLVSFDIGSTPATTHVPGAAEYTTPVKPIDGFLQHLAYLEKRLEERLEERPEEKLEGDDEFEKMRVAVVGGGAGGVELMLALEHRLTNIVGARASESPALDFALFAANDEVLAHHNRRVRRKFRRILAERRVAVHTSCPVTRVEPDALIDHEGTRHPFDTIIWVTEASAPAWIAQSGLATDDKGFLLVDEHLRSTSHPFVFAAGDVASMQHHQLAKSGVYAVRQGMPLAKNLRRAATGRRLTTYRPQKNFLSLIGTGGEYAVGSRGWLAFEGRWVWNLKEFIDRRWMRQWEELPEMKGEMGDQGHAQIEVETDSRQTLEAISTVAMRCGGCGSKLGHDVLSRVLSRLETVERDDVLVGLDAPDDSAVVRVPEGKVAVQTVDFFRSFIDDPYTFGRVAANHALGDTWAMGASPQSALAIAVVPFGAEEKVEQDLYQLMAGALEVLDEAGAALVGGHSGEGAEMSFGLQVTGLAAPDELLRKGGMQPGDALIVTKPVGTGTLFAANMRRKAKGRWIDDALRTMSQSSKDAATCLLAHGATACTDITGFGLLGHLVEMTRPSGVDVHIDLGALPVLDGAVETIQAGIASSLQPDNVRLRRALQNLDELCDHPKYPLIFDPQTAGGLLASVPAEQAEACLARLHQLGYDAAAIIGHVHQRSSAPAPIYLCADSR